jgi:hypothetical protein
MTWQHSVKNITSLIEKNCGAVIETRNAFAGNRKESPVSKETEKNIKIILAAGRSFIRKGLKRT